MSNVAQKIFEKNNISVDVKTGLSEEEIIKIIPDYDGMVVRSATKVTKSIIEAYINQLTPTEKKALEIAIRDLESSFDMEQSIGFKDWLKTHEQKS